MTTADLYGSMFQHYNEWADDESLPVHWPNSDGFTPPETGLWTKVDLLPAETFQSSVGENGFNLLSGILQISIFAPQNSFTGDLNEAVDSLLAHFKRGTVTAAVSGTSARVEKVWRSAALPDERWYMVPVNIRYFQYATNE